MPSSPRAHLRVATAITRLAWIITSAVLLSLVGAFLSFAVPGGPSLTLVLVPAVVWALIGLAWTRSPRAATHLAALVLRWQPVGEARSVLGPRVVALLEDRGVSLEGLHVFRLPQAAGDVPLSLFDRCIALGADDLQALEQDTLDPDVAAGVVAHEVGHLKRGQLPRPFTVWVMVPARRVADRFQMVRAELSRQRDAGLVNDG